MQGCRTYTQPFVVLCLKHSVCASPSPVTFDVDVVTITIVRSVTQGPIAMEHRDMGCPQLLYGTATVTCRVVRKGLVSSRGPVT